MTTEILTDEQIDSLLEIPKRIENPGAKTRTEGKHTRRDFRVKSVDDKHEFALFVRQSTLLPDSFSAGLRWLSQSGEAIMLVRFNGMAQATRIQTHLKVSASSLSTTYIKRRNATLLRVKRMKVTRKQQRITKQSMELCTALLSDATLLG